MLRLIVSFFTTVMYKNTALKAWTENLVAKIGSSLGYNNTEDEDQLGGSKRGSISNKRRASFVAELTGSTERTPLLGKYKY